MTKRSSLQQPSTKQMRCLKRKSSDSKMARSLFDSKSGRSDQATKGVPCSGNHVYLVAAACVSLALSLTMAWMLGTRSASPVFILVNEDGAPEYTQRNLVCDDEPRSHRYNAALRFNIGLNKESDMCDGLVDLVAIVTDTLRDPWTSGNGQRSLLNAKYWYNMQEMTRKKRGRKGHASVIEFRTVSGNEGAQTKSTAGHCGSGFSEGAWRVTNAHLDVCRHLLSSGLTSAAVLEDSVELLEPDLKESNRPSLNWAKNVMKIHSAACRRKARWDVLTLGQIDAPEELEPPIISNGGMFAYIVRRSGCKRLLKAFESEPAPIDRLLARLRTESFVACRPSSVPLARITSSNPHVYLERNVAPATKREEKMGNSGYVPLKTHILNRLHERVLLINLKQRESKRRLAHFTLKEHGIEFTRVQALNGMVEGGWPDTLYKEYLNKTQNAKQYINSAGAMGLLLTYRKILNDARTSGVRRMLVLEDDIMLHRDLYKLLCFALQRESGLWDEFDVLHLGSNQLSWSNEIKQVLNTPGAIFYRQAEYTHNPRYPYHDCTYSSFAVSYGPRALRELYWALRKPNNLTLAFDLAICDLVFKKILKGATFYPQLFIADVTTSDNMGPRGMEEFSKTRHWELPAYNGFVNADMLFLVDALKRSQLNIRHLISKYKHNPEMVEEAFLEILMIFSGTKDVHGILERVQSFLSGVVKSTHSNGGYWLKDLAMLMEGHWTPFVIIITGHNVAEYIEETFGSIFAQDYPVSFFRVIFVNDGSTDRTSEALRDYVMAGGLKVSSRVLGISTKEQLGPAHSRFLAYKLVGDAEVVLHVDGDDRLAHKGVLSKLHEMYSDQRTEVTFGQFYYDEGLGGPNADMPLSGVEDFPFHVVDSRSYRRYKWISQHLRTGYGYLFKSIPAAHLQDKHCGWLPYSTDLAEMLWVLEQSRGHHRNSGEGMYIYNKTASLTHPGTSYYLTKDDPRRAEIEQWIRGHKTSYFNHLSES
ncbi:hypothetical protein BSKO_11220 [Bryopsis sp. KO-2023]|nr:hypothetical protein BSKO_11220 [Bryopsis sp. KO-2023]